jgi:hypothetical protein
MHWSQHLGAGECLCHQSAARLRLGASWVVGGLGGERSNFDALVAALGGR